jgi:hypothetical protein
LYDFDLQIPSLAEPCNEEKSRNMEELVLTKGQMEPEMTSLAPWEMIVSA